VKPAAPRPRRKRGSLSRDVILDAAEAICESEGYDALSMRAVAARLGATPMALYNHFATREELVNALLNRVLSRFVPAEDLKGFARAHRKVLSDHPWAVAPIFSHPNPGSAAVAIGENAFEILGNVGDPMAAFSGLIALNYGWASFTVAGGDLEGYGTDAHYERVLGALVDGLQVT
jgi:AcrR family transcriptional regulator